MGWTGIARREHSREGLRYPSVNRRPNGTHYRRAKGDHLAALRWVDAGRGLRAGAGAGRA